MTTLVRIHRKGQMTLPSRLRSAIGIAEGDVVQATIQGGSIVLKPTLVVDRSGFPTADDEYTPAQRRAIMHGINQSLKEYRQGKFAGPFSTHEEFIADLHKQSAKLGAKTKKPNRSRR